MVGMPKLKRRLHTQGGLWLTDLAMQDGLAGTPFCTPKLRMSVELRSLYTSDFTCIIYTKLYRNYIRTHLANIHEVDNSGQLGS